jgi:hypothetical protein
VFLTAFVMCMLYLKSCVIRRAQPLTALGGEVVC